MTKDVYQTLKKHRDERRGEVKAEPKLLEGFMLPLQADSCPKDEFFEQGVMAWTRIAMSTILNAGETLGWDKYLNLLGEKQAVSVNKLCIGLVKEFDIKSKSAMDCVRLMVSHAKGDLFWWHRHPVITGDYMEGIGTWCPQVTALEEMGMGARASDVRLWCDTMDYLISRTLNPNVFMTHAHCPLSGNRYCRFFIEDRGSQPPGANFYQRIKYVNDEKRKHIENEEPEPKYLGGFGAPRFVEPFTKLELMKDGIRVKGTIARENMLIFTNAVGMEKFINLIAKEQSWGYNQAAMKLRRDFNITGTTLRDAASLAMIGYAMLGFDNHHIIHYTEERVEGIGIKCPIVESAKQLDMQDKIGEFSLWCDFYHNHPVHVINLEYQLTHTHCIGRGDKYCRFLIK